MGACSSSHVSIHPQSSAYYLPQNHFGGTRQSYSYHGHDQSNRSLVNYQRRSASVSTSQSGRHSHNFSPYSYPSSPSGNNFPRASLPTISRFDFSKHNTDDSAWVLVNGKIYDVTPFLSKHPGGRTILLGYAGGRDATTAFQNAHPGKSIGRNVRCIGILGE